LRTRVPAEYIPVPEATRALLQWEITPGGEAIRAGLPWGALQGAADSAGAAFLVAGAAETAVAVDVDNKAVIRQGSVRHNSTISVISQSRVPVKMQVASWPAEVMTLILPDRACRLHS
jgi:hypothetical protein